MTTTQARLGSISTLPKLRVLIGPHFRVTLGAHIRVTDSSSIVVPSNNKLKSGSKPLVVIAALSEALLTLHKQLEEVATATDR